MKAPPSNRGTRNTGRTRKAGGTPYVRIREILVPVDFSAASKRALIVAGQWAQRFAARLHLIYVIEPPTVPQWGYVFLALREDKLRKAAEGQLKRLLHLVPSQAAVTTEVRSGYGAEYEICQSARKRKTNLIVIGSHGAGPIRRALMGSSAEHVVRHAPCPVLVIREGIHSIQSEARMSGPSRTLPEFLRELNNLALRRLKAA
jgi:universal stress protein A